MINKNNIAAAPHAIPALPQAESSGSTIPEMEATIAELEAEILPYIEDGDTASVKDLKAEIADYSEMIAFAKKIAS